MSEETTVVDHNTDAKVRKCVRKHLGDIISVVFVQVMARLLVLAVAALPIISGGKYPWWMSISGALILYVFMMMPLRCHGGESLRRMFFTRNLHSGDRIPYKKWLKTDLLRHIRGFLWGIPLIALTVVAVMWGHQLYYGENAPAQWRRVQDLARLVGREPSMSNGLPVALVGIALLGLVFGLLFAYGWWRDMPVEYLPSRSIGPVKTIHWARRIRKHHGKEVIRITLINMALCVPGALGIQAVLIRYGLRVMKYIRANKAAINGGSFQFRSVLSKLPMPSHNELLLLAGVAVIVYLPLCVYRKMRNASLVADLMKGSSSHHHSHEAG